MSQKPISNVTIVNETGVGSDTKTYVGGTLMEWITNIKIEFSVGDLARATIEVIMPMVNIELREMDIHILEKDEE